jgi:general stress protein 26
MAKHLSEEPTTSGNDSVFTKQEAIDQAKDIISHSNTCLVGTIREDGYPNIKAMTNRKHENLKTMWFATDTSSRRTQQIRKDNRACVYCLDTGHSRGLMLVGYMEIFQDMDSKRMLWIDGEEQYRPLGVDDPEYSVLRFTAKQADVVDAMKNKGLTFEIE